MAAPTYNDDLTDVDTAEAATNWAELTASGWTQIGSTPAANPDDFAQQANCVSAQVKTGVKSNVGGIMADNGSGITLNTDDAVLMWFKYDSTGGLATKFKGGIRCLMGSGLGVFYSYNDSGNAEYPYGMGWVNFALGDPDDSDLPSPDDTVGGISSGFTKQFFGMGFNINSAPSKGDPFKIDCIRYGRCEIQVYNGDGTTPGTFTGMAEYNDFNDGTNGWNRFGLFQGVPGGYLWKGLMSFGITATACDFRDSNAAITIQDTQFVTPNFNKIEVNHASSRVDWTGVSISSLCTQSPGRFECVADADINWLLCTFNDMDTFVFQSNSAALGCTWNRCGLITLGEANLAASSFLEPTVAADEGAVYDNRTTTAETDISELDNCTFSQGANAHHAIRFGTNVNDDINLVGIEFTGFSGTADSTGATLRFDATSGTMNVNLSGCTVDGSGPTWPGNFGIDDAAGITVTVVIDPVTTTITAKDAAGDPIQYARVYAVAADGTGPMPYQDAVTMEDYGGAEQVNHTSHGMLDGDYVLISGADDELLNGVHQITYIGGGTYTIPDTGATVYTGTIKSTWVLFNEETDVLGQVSDTRTFASDQPLEGRVRKSSASPLFKTSTYAEDIDKDLGLSLTVQLTLDE